MAIQYAPSALVLRGWLPSEDYSIAAVYAPVPSGTTTNFTDLTVADLTYSGRNSTGSSTKYDVAVTQTPGSPIVTLASDTPSICTVAANGVVTALTTGVCTVRATGQTGSRKIDMVQSVSGAQTFYDSVSAPAVGSLRKYLYDQQIAALSGVTAGGAAQRAHVFLNNIAAGGSVISPWETHGAVNTSNFLFGTKAGYAGFPSDILTAVLATPGATVDSRVWLTPRHYITGLGAAHGKPPGPSYRLVGGDGVIYYSGTPWAGALAKVLPTTWKTKMPDALTVSREIPCWARLYNTYDGKSDTTAERRWVQPANFLRSPFDSTDARYPYQKRASNGSLANGGDSGSPVFCGINGSLVILSHVTFQGLVGNDDYGALTAAINTAMNELATYNSDAAAGTYAVQTADLSGFTTYP